MKKNKQIPSRKMSIEQETLTREKFRPIFEDIKELVQSTAKGTEAALTRKIDGVSERVSRTELAITKHSKLIKGLDTKVTALDAKIDSVRTELKEDNKNLKAELKDDMRQMERRLSDKIDGSSSRLEDHETRISALEQAP